MPISDQHRKQRAKNMVLLMMCAGLVVVLFALSFIRVKALA